MKNTIPDNRMSQLSEFIASSMGLHFPPERWGDLERNIMPAAREFDFTDTGAFIRWLVTSAINTEQMEILTSHLTVNETYFWREPEVFNALTEKILPEIINLKSRGEKRLRIWSAACSSGEEPYSLAIALHRAMPAIKDWNITILATDINPRILKKAAAGVYGEWSFRNAPAWLKEKYFCRRPDGKHEINPDIRKMVVFAYLNLAEDIYPTPVNNTNAMDIIFCRNVLMYFVPSRGKQVAHNLYKSLVDGGYLMVGACELSQAQFPQFSAVCFPGAIVYRKDGQDFEPAAALDFSVTLESFQNTGIQPESEDNVLPELEIVQPGIFASKTLPEDEKSESPEDTYEEALGLYAQGKYAQAVKTLDETPNISVTLAVRALANEGNLSEALALCEKAIIKEKLNPTLHYLRAAILQEQNREDEAIASLKRSLYLDQNLILAHFTLGNLMLRQGNFQNTKKCFRNALSLLEMLKHDEILPESDGLTAGRFREIINATMQAGIPV
jgi:chemotaxis protein methyltransferase CheR